MQTYKNRKWGFNLNRLRTINRFISYKLYVIDTKMSYNLHFNQNLGQKVRENSKSFRILMSYNKGLPIYLDVL